MRRSASAGRACSLQPMYNLVKRQAEVEILRWRRQTAWRSSRTAPRAAGCFQASTRARTRQPGGSRRTRCTKAASRFLCRILDKLAELITFDYGNITLIDWQDREIDVVAHRVAGGRHAMASPSFSRPRGPSIRGSQAP